MCHTVWSAMSVDSHLQKMFWEMARNDTQDNAGVERRQECNMPVFLGCLWIVARSRVDRDPNSLFIYLFFHSFV